MWKFGGCCLALFSVSCGYSWVSWSSSTYATVAILPVKTNENARPLRTRMRDALIERCLAGSGLRPTDQQGDLVLATEILDYQENVIATAVDGRISRIQFYLLANFYLRDARGNAVWVLENYRYSDQFNLSSTQNEYRDETIFVQDNALRTIADLVITNITLTITETGLKRETTP